MDGETKKALHALRALAAIAQPGFPMQQAADLAIADLVRLSGQVNDLVVARERLAMLVPIGLDVCGTVEDQIEDLLARLAANRDDARRRALLDAAEAIDEMPDFAGRVGAEAMEGILRSCAVALLREMADGAR